MTKTIPNRQRRVTYPVSVSIEETALDVIDRAAAIRSESRASYIRRTVLREANADLREAERKAQAVA
jgi:uncharacterized protein (DUF1778 family)